MKVESDIIHIKSNPNIGNLYIHLQLHVTVVHLKFVRWPYGFPSVSAD